MKISVSLKENLFFDSMVLDKILLFPYYAVLACRHALYNSGILKSTKFSIPTIVVGNITVGGTGKTPMVELLIRMFQGECRIAVISRGYKRKSKGLREVLVEDNYKETGDEPLQIKRKFPNVRVYVDGNRGRAISFLEQLPEDERPELILLDDAFQHRKVKGDCSIVLIDSSRPTYSDYLLPMGNLRDLPGRVKAADIVVVTKIQGDLDYDTREHWRTKLSLSQNVPLHFSKISYLKPVPLFPEQCDARYAYAKNAVLFSGIANDRQIKLELGWRYTINESVKFADHHNFSKSDMKSIARLAKKNHTAIVVTTEKDAQRLAKREDLPEILKERLFYIPIISEIIPEAVSVRCIEEELGEIGMAQLKESIVKYININ